MLQSTGRMPQNKKKLSWSILDKWRTAISTNTGGLASHLLLGAPDQQMIHSVVEYATQAPKSALLREVVPAGRDSAIGEPFTAEGLAVLGLHGVFLADTGKISLEAQTADAVASIHAASSMFPRIRAAELRVQLYMLDSPDIATLDTLHIISGCDKMHPQIVSMLSSDALWARVVCFGDLDRDEDSDASDDGSSQWANFEPREAYLAALYCKSVLQPHVTAKLYALKGSCQITLRPTALDGAARRSHRSLNEFIDSQASALQDRLCTTPRPESIAITPLRRYGAVFSVQREARCSPLMSATTPRAPQVGCLPDVSYHPWQLSCWALCNQGSAARRLHPFEMWVLAQTRDTSGRRRSRYEDTATRCVAAKAGLAAATRPSKTVLRT